MRLEGWECRLYEVIDDARARPYELGVHDCFKVSCEVLKALTGVDRWPEFFGYQTKAQAMALIARHGSSWNAAFDWFFGCSNIPPAFARVGDICTVLADKEKHLGVCLGINTGFLGPAGFIY